MPRRGNGDACSSPLLKEPFMTDYSNSPLFAARLVAAESAISELAEAGVEDANKLVIRSEGWNNLQGHARAVIPLAIWFLTLAPTHTSNVRDNTYLTTDMSSTSTEAQAAFWEAIQNEMKALLGKQGSDRIVVGTQSNSPETAERIAETYLSERYGGGQTSGGAGDTVFKRTLKIVSHVFNP